MTITFDNHKNFSYIYREVYSSIKIINYDHSEEQK